MIDTWGVFPIPKPTSGKTLVEILIDIIRKKRKEFFKKNGPPEKIKY